MPPGSQKNKRPHPPTLSYSPPTQSPPPPHDVDDGGSSPSQSGKARKQDDKIKNLYNKYANQISKMIDPEGIETLCKDLNVDVTDVRVLMLAWKLKAQRQGYFSWEEWQIGLKDLSVETLPKLKEALPGLEQEVMGDTQKYEDFYGYSFKYCLTEDMQKTVDIETVCELLKLVLGLRFRGKVDLLVEFLKEQSEYKALTMDQWVNFYRVCNEIDFGELQSYDSYQAWPVIVDSFVEWMSEKQKH